MLKGVRANSSTGSGSPGGSANDLQYNFDGVNFGGITMTNGQILVGQTGAPPLAKTLTGDITLAASGATAVAAIAGTAVSGTTGSTNVVFSNSPVLVTPALGTPASANLSNATSLPISSGVSGLAAGIATFLGTPSSANLAAAMTDETGTGANVFADSPTITTLLAVTGTETITSASANAFAVGPAGTTNPSFNIDASTASAASGLNLKTAASGSGITLSTIGGTNEGVTFNPKGSGGWTYQFSGGGRLALRSFSTTATQPNSAYIALNKSHSNTVGTFTIVQNNEVCGGIVFGGANGGAGSFDTAAQILGVVDGTPGSSADMPGRLEFYTTPDGSATPAIALTLSSTKIATFASDVNAAGNFISNTAAKGLVLKQGANGKCGTFVCNGITPVTVSNTSIAITDVIIASLNTVGGTVGNVPSVRTITAATGFTIAGSSLDTSTYNYIIISNAA